MHVPIDTFVDLDSSKRGELFQGRPIRDKEVLRDIASYFIFIAVACHYESIIHQLMELGYSKSDFVHVGLNPMIESKRLESIRFHSTPLRENQNH